MVALGNHAFFAAVTLLSATELLQRAEAHPGCANNFVLSLTRETVFCPTDEDDLYANGVCCDAAKEAEIVGTLDASDTTGTCAQMYKEVRDTVWPSWPIRTVSIVIGTFFQSEKGSRTFNSSGIRI